MIGKQLEINIVKPEVGIPGLGNDATGLELCRTRILLASRSLCPQWRVLIEGGIGGTHAAARNVRSLRRHALPGLGIGFGHASARQHEQNY